MKDNTGFFKTYHDPQRGWMINNYPNKMVGGINDNECNITSGLQKVFTDKSYDTAISMNDTEKLFLEIAYKKLIMIIGNDKKDPCQVVIDIWIYKKQT